MKGKKIKHRVKVRLDVACNAANSKVGLLVFQLMRLSPNIFLHSVGCLELQGEPKSGFPPQLEYEQESPRAMN